MVADYQVGLPVRAPCPSTTDESIRATTRCGYPSGHRTVSGNARYQYWVPHTGADLLPTLLPAGSRCPDGLRVLWRASRAPPRNCVIRPFMGGMFMHINMLPSTGRLPHMGAGD